MGVVKRLLFCFGSAIPKQVQLTDSTRSRTTQSQSSQRTSPPRCTTFPTPRISTKHSSTGTTNPSWCTNHGHTHKADSKRGASKLQSNHDWKMEAKREPSAPAESCAAWRARPAGACCRCWQRSTCCAARTPAPSACSCAPPPPPRATSAAGSDPAAHLSARAHTTISNRAAPATHLPAATICNTSRWNFSAAFMVHLQASASLRWCSWRLGYISQAAGHASCCGSWGPTLIWSSSITSCLFCRTRRADSRFAIRLQSNPEQPDISDTRARHNIIKLAYQF